ncbi:MAG TPA: Gfo/Idh/MocA family oxidoreductase [Gemmataceae bacterium]|nr:Gfo/Idh/MocA family oxidoreductase [Gemmataceae bacterium]
MSLLNRRDFLHDSAALAALLAGAGALDNSLRADEEKAARKKGDVNDQLRVAVVGVNGQGKAHVGGYAGKHNCIVATICDVDEAVIGPAMRAAEQAQGKAPKYEKDLRKVLDDKSIDIVSIATPNHWHALAAIWAMQAGKDVYVEKPVSHNVSEGRRIVEVARKLKRICQTGTQSRSMTGMREAIAFLHSGKLGKVQVARGLCYKPRGSIGKVAGPQQPPATCDYDLWCGPAPVKPVMRKRFHYDWHWQWDYGNGDLGNQGIHEMDKARWGLQKNELPRSVISVGGRFGYVDDGETANTQICVFDYGDAQLIFEVRGLKTDALRDCKVGNIFHCTEGLLVCPNYYSGVALRPDGEVIQRFSGGTYDAHFGNFVEAVRSRKAEHLNADILEGHLSSALCHLGNISYRLGELVPFNKQTQAFGDNKEAVETFTRMVEHLKENSVPLDSTMYRLGPKLMIDPKTETFINNPAANAQLTREYRKGFVVPDKA